MATTSTEKDNESDNDMINWKPTGYDMLPEGDKA